MINGSEEEEGPRSYDEDEDDDFATCFHNEEKKGERGERGKGRKVIIVVINSRPP